MATLLVSVPHGHCVPYSYCICNSWSISYSCFICGSYFICDFACPALAACPIQFSLPNFITPCPRMSPVTVSSPTCWVCSQMGASSGSACGGVLTHLHCSPSSREDCHLATVWSKRCWRWRSKSLTVANGSGIEATICTGMLFTVLACLAWFSISCRSGSLS